MLDAFLAGERTEAIADRLCIHRNAVHVLVSRAVRRNNHPTRYTLIAAYAIEQRED